MTVSTVAEALGMGKGATVPALKAQVKKVGKQFSGQGQYGPWTVQTLDLMDATAKVQAKFWNRAPLDAEWVNHWIYLESGLDGKGKQSGITIDEDTYRGKTSKVLKINEHCVMSDSGTSTAPVAPTQSAQAPTTPAQAPVSPATAPIAPAQTTTQAPQQQKGNGAAAVDRLRGHLAQHAVALEIAFDGAVYVAKKVMEKHKVDISGQENLRALAISMLIGAEREGLLQGLPMQLKEGKQ